MISRFNFLFVLFLGFTSVVLSCDSTYAVLGGGEIVPPVAASTKERYYALANLTPDERLSEISKMPVEEAFALLREAMRVKLGLHSSGGDRLPPHAQPSFTNLAAAYPWLKGAEGSLSQGVRDGFSREWVQDRITEASRELADHILSKASAEERAEMAKTLLEDVYRLPPDWYAQTRADQIIDRLLDLRSEAVTQRLQEKSREEIGALYGNEETWFEYGNGWLLTPSFEFRLILDRLNPKPGETLVDLGSGMGRQGIYMGLMHPEVNFHGYEIVTERADEGERVAKKLKLSSVQFHKANMADPSWKPEPADYYYAFNPVSGSTFDKVLLDLRSQAIEHQKPFKIVVSGPAAYAKLEAAPWLKEITHAPRFAEDDFARVFEFQPPAPSRETAALSTPSEGRPLSLEDKDSLTRIFEREKPDLTPYSFPYIWGTQSTHQWQVASKDGATLLYSDQVRPGKRLYMEPLGVSVQEKAKIISDILASDPKATFDDIHAPVANQVNFGKGHTFVGSPDFAEYVYRSQDLVELNGTKRQREFRKRLDKFWAAHGGEGSERVQFVPLDTLGEREKASAFVEDWAEKRMAAAPSASLAEELESTRTLLRDYSQLGLQGYALVIDGNVQGVTLGMKMANGKFATYVEKANHEIPSIYQAINHEMAKALSASGIEEINRMDDSGVAGLRQAKRNYNPVSQVMSYSFDSAP